MISIRTAVLHNGVDASADYAKEVASQITDECAVVDAYTNAPLRHVLPLRAVPNVMVCLFCDGLEEYQEVADIINQLNYIKSQPENEPIIPLGHAAEEVGITLEPEPIELPDRPGYKWEKYLDGTVIAWHEVADPSAAGTASNPILYELGMTVKANYWYTNGVTKKVCVKSGTPASFEDSEYFEVL